MEQEYYFHEGCFITELHNTSEDPRLSIARVRVEKGKTTVWHVLQKTNEQYLILEGSGLAQKGEDPSIELTEGDTFTIPEETKQRISNIGTCDLIFLAICTPRFQEENYRKV